jgi:hypothetical protein
MKFLLKSFEIELRSPLSLRGMIEFEIALNIVFQRLYLVAFTHGKNAP